LHQLDYKHKRRSNRAILQLPHPLLSHAFEYVIKQLYGISYDPHIVRQHRDLHVGSLDIIDYAFPCFELATKLHKSVDSIASEICSELTTNNIVIKKYGVKEYYFDAVSGYVNVKLSTSAIEHGVTAARQWLAVPGSLPNLDTTAHTFITVEGEKGSPDMAVQNMANLYLQQTYALVGKRQSVTYLVKDFSESTIPRLVNALKNEHGQTMNVTAVHNKVREFFGDPNSAEREVSPVFISYASIRQDLLLDYNKQISQAGTHKYKCLYEKDLWAAAGRYLRSIEKKKVSKALMVDTQSSALYFASKLDAVPLRSTKGIVYSNAYILYVLARSLDTTRLSAGRVIVFAPNAMHQRIYEFASLLGVSKRDKRRLLCFDPKVSQADIIQLSNMNSTLQDHFTDIAFILGSFNYDWLDKKASRYALLALIDLPTDVMSLINGMQFPGIFDALAHSAETLSALLDEDLVHITAD
jgi:hypothetical protein